MGAFRSSKRSVLCLISNKPNSISARNHPESDIQQLVNHTADVVKLNLKPGNRESAPIKSIKVQTSDIVVRVTVPKRTGHKRKRGSDGPFWTPNCSPARPTDGSHPTSSVGSQVKRFLRSLKDNEGQYEVEVVGQVIDTYRFRGLAFLLLITQSVLKWVDLPDFVFSTAGSPFMSQMRDKILPGDCKPLMTMTRFRYRLMGCSHEVEGFHLRQEQGCETEYRNHPSSCWNSDRTALQLCVSIPNPTSLLWSLPIYP